MPDRKRDIIKRLKENCSPYECTPRANLIHEAATEIKSLRRAAKAMAREIKELRNGQSQKVA